MPGYKKLGRTSDQRKAILRGLVTDLLRNERITTTQMRAKEAGRRAEKMITLAKRGDLHARRQVLAYVYDEDVVTKLFDEIEVDEEKLITFPQGIIGFPDLKDFLLIHDS